MVDFITDYQIYQKVIIERVLYVKKYLWIATSDIKDMYVHGGKNMVPFLERLADMIERGVSVRLIHAKEPGKNFRKDFDRFPVLYHGLERILCPRIHFKSIIVDGNMAYTGSANLTGAGLGAKSPNKRNFESGIITDDKTMIKKIMFQFDNLWMGNNCESCGRKEFCTEYKDLVVG